MANGAQGTTKRVVVDRFVDTPLLKDCKRGKASKKSSLSCLENAAIQNHEVKKKFFYLFP